MSSVTIELTEDVISLLRESSQPVEDAAREMIVWELYRRGSISRGRAAELLNLDLLTFIQRASGLGIPYVDMTEEEWKAEMQSAADLAKRLSSLSTPARLSP
jgi:predicted HTH domain antitoxin